MRRQAEIETKVDMIGARMLHVNKNVIENDCRLSDEKECIFKGSAKDIEDGKDRIFSLIAR